MLGYPPEREMLGARPKARIAPVYEEPEEELELEPEFEADATIPEAVEIETPQKVVPSELEKAVRRMPTIYVIAFFAVVVGCAVMMIWNTLQVNKLTLERTRLEDKIAQTEQRLIKLRAEEMQLSAPSRIRDLVKAKFGMVEETGDELVIVK